MIRNTPADCRKAQSVSLDESILKSIIEIERDHMREL